MSSKRHELAIIIIAAALTAIGCAILIAALIIPPPGQIDHSVLVAFGEILTFVAALLGVSFNIKNKNQ